MHANYTYYIVINYYYIMCVVNTKYMYTILLFVVSQIYFIILELINIYVHCVYGCVCILTALASAKLRGFSDVLNIHIFILVMIMLMYYNYNM